MHRFWKGKIKYQTHKCTLTNKPPLGSGRCSASPSSWWGETRDRWILCYLHSCHKKLSSAESYDGGLFQMAHQDLWSSISHEFSANTKSDLKTILQYTLNHPAFFADRLCYSVKGAGTDDFPLVRIVITWTLRVTAKWDWSTNKIHI